ncbi:collagen alpha-1(V) chain-like [Mytilus edulis]|uniref:collagen alpha-1(V) chain-like n=1 Tax=Mytilus edulis TaxID=6550 RepID=UPI0039EF0096
MSFGKGLKTKFFEPEVSGKIVPLYPLLKDFFNLNNNSPNNEIDRDLNNNCQESRNGPQSEQKLDTHVPTPEQGTGANKNTFPGPNMMSNMMQANEPLPKMCGPPLLLSTQLSTPDGPIVKGESGLDGLPGVGGSKGDTGFPGQIGRAGNKGESGPPGLNGSPGLACLDGPRGENGPSGLPGRDGEPGLPGMKGDGGLPGFDGLPGPKGNPGNNGLPCVSGEKGNPGFSGPNGAPGLPGPKGERGFNGRDGSKGEPGRTSEGSKGEPGLPGRSGLDGLPGMKGDVGFAGRDGFPSAKGESGNPGLEGIGQKGSRGLDGLPGSAGLPGESGVDGLTGVNGRKGESGDRGLNGLPGPQGNNGLDGCKDHNSPNNEIDEHLNNNCQECRNGPQSEQKLDTHVPTPEQGTGANKNSCPGPNMMSNMMQANEPLPEMCGPPLLLSTQLSTPDGPIVNETPQNDTDIDETMVKVPYEEDRGGNKGTPAPPQSFINLTRRPHDVSLNDEDLNSPKNEIDRDLNNNCQECRNGPQSEQLLNTHVPTTEQKLNVQQAYDLEVSNLTLSFVRNLRIVEEEKQNLLVDLTAERERCANLEDSKESLQRQLASASLYKEQLSPFINFYDMEVGHHLCSITGLIPCLFS